MASKLEEHKAWLRLKKYAQNETYILKIERASYHNKGEAEYSAYIAGAKPNGWTDHFPTPMAAVDAVIAMREVT